MIDRERSDLTRQEAREGGKREREREGKRAREVNQGSET